MEPVWSNQIDKILKVGHSLDNVGVQNWALTKDQALNALEQFSTLEISILGGDVYEYVDGIIRSSYDSWYCDSHSGEAKRDFVKRSIEKAKSYIEAYKVEDVNKVFFVFVPDT
ncbi:MAG: Imm40 family immunity protein [Bacteroidota bacterium]|nr:Imm40 family immunity protein [Bacteroidota bacterium]